MTICEEHGDSVLVYDGSYCPACITIEDLESQVSEGDDRITELETQLDDAKS